MLATLGTAVLIAFIVYCVIGWGALGVMGILALPDAIGDAAGWIYRTVRPRAAEEAISEVEVMASSLIVVAAFGAVIYALGYVLKTLLF